MPPAAPAGAVTLPRPSRAFYFAAAAQLEPALRPAFTERVATILQSHADPGPGGVDRAVRQALIGLWVPPPVEEVKNASRWNRPTLGFDRIKARTA